MRECKGLGARLINFNNAACHPLPTRVVYACTHDIFKLTGTTRSRDLCLHQSSNLCMCGSPTDENIAQILLFLDDILSGIWCEFVL